MGIQGQTVVFEEELGNYLLPDPNDQLIQR